MALTLTEGEKYSRTELQRAIIDRLVKDSRVLELLPFATILGNSLTYNTITTDSGAGFYDVGDTWTETTPTLTQATAALKVLGGDADIDNFLLKTRSNIIDLKGTVVANKVKAVQYKFLDQFFYGTSVDSTGFSGLQQLLADTTYNTVQSQTASADGAAGSTTTLRQTIDLITGWKPTHIAMSKTVRRRLSVYLDSIGSAFPAGRDEYGRPIQIFDGMEIVVDDHILNTEATTAAGAFSLSTGDDQSSIFVLSFDEMAACGIHSGDGVQVEPLGSLETKDAQRFRIKWYVAMMLQDIRSCAKYIGILTGSAWAA